MTRVITGISMVTLLAVVAGAQAPPPGTAQERRKVQQERTAQGIASGQLTPAEAARIEKNEAKINQEIKTDRAANGGKLTPQERKQINNQQNKVSQQIYNQKHDAQTQKYGNNEVDARRQNQQQRIAQGVASGKLSAGEASKLEKHEAAINKQVRSERAANGGHLTGNEKAQVNREQNRESKKIFDKKHN